MDGIGCVETTPDAVAFCLFQWYDNAYVLRHLCHAILWHDCDKQKRQQEKKLNRQMERRQTRQRTINEKFLCGVAFSIWCYSFSHVNSYVRNAIQKLWVQKFSHFQCICMGVSCDPSLCCQQSFSFRNSVVLMCVCVLVSSTYIKHAKHWNI